MDRCVDCGVPLPERSLRSPEIRRCQDDWLCEVKTEPWVRSLFEFKYSRELKKDRADAAVQAAVEVALTKLAERHSIDP